MTFDTTSRRRALKLGAAATLAAPLGLANAARAQQGCPADPTARIPTSLASPLRPETLFPSPPFLQPAPPRLRYGRGWGLQNAYRNSPLP